MFALLLTLATFFSGNTFTNTYNTVCKYNDITTTLKTCDEESGSFVFIYNVSDDNNITLYYNGEPKTIINKGILEKYHTMNDGTNSEIVSCYDWDLDKCRLQHGTDFVRITYSELDIKLYFYNK